jgi:hypothetical protein
VFAWAPILITNKTHRFSVHNYHMVYLFKMQRQIKVIYTHCERLPVGMQLQSLNVGQKKKKNVGCPTLREK